MAGPAALLLLAPGCGDCPRCKPGGKNEPVATNTVTRYEYGDYQKLVADALASTRPAADTTVEQFETDLDSLPETEANLLRKRLVENAEQLHKQIADKNQFEANLRKNDPEGRRLHEAREDSRKAYEQYVADQLKDSITIGRIAMHTHLQNQLLEQLRKELLRNPEETP